MTTPFDVLPTTRRREDDDSAGPCDSSTSNTSSKVTALMYVVRAFFVLMILLRNTLEWRSFLVMTDCDFVSIVVEAVTAAALAAL